MSAPVPEEVTFFTAVGGEETFRRLVDKFYEGVAQDPLLRPMYPEEDLGPAADRLALFLMQYWGGPNTYSASRGHPRLRMRHAPFRVGPAERDAWLAHMRVAVDSLGLPAELHTMLWDYLERAAYFMVNTMDPAV
ncbi:globin [Actinoplanes oblitus]|uniref:Globin n=1 Tax=Actinoplanes oblitus TaxID=3040509 RepID=A0ABY8WL73_9ACTN|nr:globin [Actinoplanes oblitus]WIM97610.1 globin [Actinoplanes oblitus]